MLTLKQNMLFKAIIVFAFLFLFITPAFASSSAEAVQNTALVNRANAWPGWKLPGSFNSLVSNRDIVYPSWFMGLWLVESIDLKSPKEKPIEYQAKFKISPLNEVVGDRSFNALSVGKAILGDQLLSVKDDPKSPNRQLAIFDDQAFLETKVIGRNQSSKNESEFFVDELVLQIFHTLDVSRVKQVETLSKYRLCKSKTFLTEELSLDQICGEQWQAIYSAPGEMLGSQVLKTSHYQLILRRLST